MDFYEELGVSRTASEAEIRKSYRRLTLLLHPDQQQDPEIRILAEGQMKRINEMVAILTDPERRRMYDESLSEKALVVRQIQITQWISWVRDNRGWVLVGVAFVLVLISALLVPVFDSAHSAGKAHEPVAAFSAASRRTPEQRELGSPSKALANSRLPAVEQRTHEGDWKPAPGLPAPQVDSPLSSARVETPVSETPRPKSVLDSAIPVPPPTPAQGVVPSPVQSAPSALRPAPTLAGRWVYTPDPSDPGDPKLYPAEYAELSIAPVGNALRGVYQARYKLPDRNLNSRVNFTFEGPPSGTSFVWQGDSGAQGEITVRLESADTLKVNWFATKMGSVLSLGSGNATLYRFR